ncbi:hypothetical protein C2845_PM10G09650 [Panicum miliaceum]|uniref:PHD-type domain-containing protein n=1 Tax=Panicum miliaceum TaxID=4540 RepID=A0A3L6PDD0_PANMI|nr:hypothetical protein C2845_PM10G09650 [Panicum miliaceum]
MGFGRKRRRGGGELGRVAEIVMVLAGAGKARGGRAPTAAERALAAEARGALAAVVAGEVELRPRELFTTEAVRALVEDLGLTRARDPAAVGFRPRIASIAHRVLLTKRKMEEGKEALVPSTTVPKMTASSAKNGFQHGDSKVATGSPRNLSTPVTSPVISKQPLLNGTVAGASSIKLPNIHSAVSLPPVGSADVKMEIVNGSNFTQNGGAETIEQSNKSGHHTANNSNRSSLQSSSQAEKSVDEKRPAIYPVTGSVGIGSQAPNAELSVQKQTIFSNHKAIAKNVERILQQPANHSSWCVPSTEYMNTRLDCQICKVPITNMGSLLVCDACERGTHVKCLQYYGKQSLPKPEWYCPTCVLHSKGKPLPPKYGKVTRSIAVPKTCMTSGAQPSQIAAENPEKDGSSNKNVAVYGTVINQNTNKVGSTVCKSGTLALDATGSKSPSGAEPQKDVKHDETSSVEKEGNGLPCGGIHTETATFCNEVRSNGASTYGSSTVSIVDWVGDGLKSIDNKTYYNSCNIDGVIYNLHDHILIASEGGKFGPCKLQSLWEEHDSGSKLAMVNPYFFGSDIPGTISKPCIDEEDEVYGSNNDRILLVSAIRGPCEVLHVDKFREETKRRSFRRSSSSTQPLNLIAPEPSPAVSSSPPSPTASITSTMAEPTTADLAALIKTLTATDENLQATVDTLQRERPPASSSGARTTATSLRVSRRWTSPSTFIYEENHVYY